jgi:hypothetical protein
MSSRSRAVWRSLPHPVRWVTVAVVGTALVITGLVLMVLPGPGIPVLVLGLVVLATEFAWAEATLGRVKSGGAAALSRVRAAGRRRGSPGE